MMRVYTLQNAENVLTADYKKRNNVVRLRLEGEQFLLQFEGARHMAHWIEVSEQSMLCPPQLCDDALLPSALIL